MPLRFHPRMRRVPRQSMTQAQLQLTHQLAEAHAESEGLRASYNALLEHAQVRAFASRHCTECYCRDPA
jgi:hypothetical protein